MKDVLAKYDRMLYTKKNLDGSFSVFRRSPFSSLVKHEIVRINNQYAGSLNWMLRRLISMDTTRSDLVGEVIRHNHKMRQIKADTAMHKDVAEFMLNGNSMFIN